MRLADRVHPAHGAKLRYSNPLTGGHPFPTMSAFLQLLPAGFHGRHYRSTDNTVCVIVEGRGVVEVASAIQSKTTNEVEEQENYVLLVAFEMALVTLQHAVKQ